MPEADLEDDSPHLPKSGKELWRTARTKVQAALRFQKGGIERSKSDVKAEGPDTGKDKQQVSILSLAFLFSLVFVSGLILNVTLELLTKIDSSAGSFVSVSQFGYVIFKGVCLRPKPEVGEAKPPGTFFSRLKVYAAITAANTGSTMMYNKSLKVGGASFFPIYLTTPLPQRSEGRKPG